MALGESFSCTHGGRRCSAGWLKSDDGETMSFEMGAKIKEMQQYVVDLQESPNRAVPGVHTFLRGVFMPRGVLPWVRESE